MYVLVQTAWHDFEATYFSKGKFYLKARNAQKFRLISIATNYEITMVTLQQPRLLKAVAISKPLPSTAKKSTF